MNVAFYNCASTVELVAQFKRLLKRASRKWEGRKIIVHVSLIFSLFDRENWEMNDCLHFDHRNLPCNLPQLLWSQPLGAKWAKKLCGWFVAARSEGERNSSVFSWVSHFLIPFTDWAFFFSYFCLAFPCTTAFDHCNRLSVIVEVSNACSCIEDLYTRNKDWHIYGPKRLINILSFFLPSWCNR